MLCLLICCLTSLLEAQSVPQVGSVSGRVVDADTGVALLGVAIGSRETGWSETDANGRYILRGLPDGHYSISVRGNAIASNPAPFVPIAISGGRPVTAVDFRVRLSGTISGVVRDERDEPVVGARVVVMGRQFGRSDSSQRSQSIGNSDLGYVNTRVTLTDDRGRYRISDVPAGIFYRLFAYLPRVYAAPIAEATDDPRLRPRTLVASYYPSTQSFDTALPVIVHSLEEAPNIDITLPEATSYCLEATLTSGGVPGRLEFAFEEEDIARIQSFNIGVPTRPSAGFAGSDGRIRLCDLTPGRFRLIASESLTQSSPRNRNEVSIAISDHDVRDVRVTVRPESMTVRADVVWDQPPVDESIRSAVLVRPTPLVPPTIWRPPNPEHFTFPARMGISYSLVVSGLVAPYYVRDITFDSGGGESSIVMSGLLATETTEAARVRVLIGADGGTIATTARTGGGSPAVNAMVLIWPVSAQSEAAVAAELVVGLTNDAGLFSTSSLRPGEYYVLATSEPPRFSIWLPAGDPLLTKTPETMSMLLRARGAGQRILVRPNASVHVDLVPTILR
jgi:hypothetical protein